MKILVIVDMQNDFIDGALANEKGEEVTQAVLREIGCGYDRYILTRDTHTEQYLTTYEGKNLPVRHCIQDTFGWQIRKEIAQAVENTGKPYGIFDKKGFGSLEMAAALEKDREAIESITLVGLCTDICVITNALLLRARFENLPIYYVKDAMNATSDMNQEAAIRILNACQIYEKDA